MPYTARSAHHPVSRSLAGLLALLVVLAMLAVGAAPAHAETDSVAPTLVGLHLTPGSIDTGAAAQTITVVADVDDDVNGLSSGYGSYVTFQSPSSGTMGGGRSYQATLDSSKRVPGTTAQHGSYQTTVTIPRYSEQGTWKISVSLYDGMRSRYYSTTDLTNGGFTSGIEQTAPGDAAAPVLAGFDISPAQVDTSTGPQIVTVTAHITDDVSGFTSTYFQLAPPSGNRSLYVNLDSSKRTSGTPQDGIYTVALTLPRYSEQGAWRLGTGMSSSFSLSDAAGNYRSLYPGDLTTAGFPIGFTQTAPGDSAAPTLVSFAINPSTVDTSTAAQTVTVTARIKDDVSGFTSTYFSIYPPSGNSSKSLYVNLDASRRISGTAQDGTYVATLTLPRFSEQGTWRLGGMGYALGLSDVAGNTRSVTLGDLTTAGFSTGFSQTAPGDAAPPVLAGLSFSADSIDTSASAQTVTLQAHITDDLAGLNTGSCCMTSYLTFQSPSNTYGHNLTVTFDASTRVSGSATDGVYEIPLTLPRYSEQGTWKVSSGSLYDAAFNYRNLSSSDITAGGFPTTFQQTGIGDTTPPVLTIESVTPAQVDTSTSSQTVTVRTHVTDDLSGVGANGGPSFSFKSPALSVWTSAPVEASRLVSGTAWDGVYDVAVTVPRFAELGIWKLSGVSVSDALGNSINPNSMPSAAGYSASFEVTTLPAGPPPGGGSGGTSGPSVPDAPVAAVATPGNGQVALSWIAPANNGRSPVTGYSVVTYRGTTLLSTTSVTGTTATISGLANGTAYTFTVAARNAAGTGPATTASAAVAVTPYTQPGAPTAVAAIPGNGQASVSWVAPVDNGGSAITGYTVTATAGSATVATLNVTGTSATFTGLANGTAYTFTLVATNAAGSSPVSVPSAAVTPRTVPDAPSAVAATAGKSQVSLAWGPPSNNGGSPITSYTVTTYTGSTVVKTVVVSTTSAIVTGLTNGISYTFGVAATNAAGTGPATMSVAVSPRNGAGDIIEPSGLLEPILNTSGTGYWMLGAGGVVNAFGDARHLGDPSGNLGAATAVDLAPTSTGSGYLVLDDAGHVYGYGDARWLGNADSGLAAGERAISLSVTRSGNGYWVFTTRGRVLDFGDAPFYGDMSHLALNQPVIDSVPTATGLGYYMVASDGGIFAFGDAVFHGSMGGTKLNAPIRSLVPTAGGAGYWLVASDGGIFAFGDAPFRGSLAQITLNKPITGMVRYGSGYLMVAQDGGVFDFSGIVGGFLGSLANSAPTRPIIAVATLG